MNVPLVYSKKYEMDIGLHVFPTQKFRLIVERLKKEGEIVEEDIYEPESIDIRDLEIVHDKEYLDDLMNLRWTPRTLWSELPLTKEIVEGFVTSASGTWLATKLALEKGFAYHVGGGFHHAFRGHAEGFCYINDMAFAIVKGKKENLFQRALVVDCDVHQGNGTAEIFRDDPLVFTFSIHQENNYPIPKEKSDFDVGLRDGIRDDEYLEILNKSLEKIFSYFKPELIIYQAGADPYEKDQLGGLSLTKEGLRKRDELVIKAAYERRIPLVVTLGGGYAYDVNDTVEIHVNTYKVLKFYYKKLWEL